MPPSRPFKSKNSKLNNGAQKKNRKSWWPLRIGEVHSKQATPLWTSRRTNLSYQQNRLQMTFTSSALQNALLNGLQRTSKRLQKPQRKLKEWRRNLPWTSNPSKAWFSRRYDRNCVNRSLSHLHQQKRPPLPVRILEAIKVIDPTLKAVKTTDPTLEAVKMTDPAMWLGFVEKCRVAE